MSQKSVNKVAKNTPSIRAFASEVQTELRKVEWPTKQVVIQSSIIIIIMVIFFTSIVAIYDMGFSKLLISLKGL
jgi:preprotein translocase subunit SecE